MFDGKEAKPFPTISPTEPRFAEGRTVMFINDEGLTSVSETQSIIGHLILFASDADQEIEIYAPTSAANWSK